MPVKANAPPREVIGFAVGDCNAFWTAILRSPGPTRSISATNEMWSLIDPDEVTEFPGLGASNSMGADRRAGAGGLLCAPGQG
jgi:hypothetical protein